MGTRRLQKRLSSTMAWPAAVLSALFSVGTASATSCEMPAGYELTPEFLLEYDPCQLAPHIIAWTPEAFADPNARSNFIVDASLPIAMASFDCFHQPASDGSGASTD